MEAPNNPRYFDYAASSPPWRESVEAYVDFSYTYFANPSSNHMPGKEAKQQLLALKKEFCDLVHFFDGRLLLCASGTEANNTIIEGHLKRFPKGKVLIAKDVHDSIWYATDKFRKAVEIIPIAPTGQISIDKFEKALKEDITLVCLSHVCNETGTIHPIKKIAEICDGRQIKTLIDGAQSIGHVPLNLNDIPFTYFSFSGHKFGSVKSTGGLFMRDDQFDSLVHGGKQEWNLRAGTEDIAGMAAMVAAMKKNIEQLNDESARLKTLKQILIDRLKEFPHVVVNSSENSLPGLLSLSVPGHSGKEIVSALALSGFAISTGSACHENQMDPSRIILAMGRDKKEAIGTIRLSMGVGTTAESVNDLANALLDLIR